MVRENDTPGESWRKHFQAETEEGRGASHQTGWTALIVRGLEDVAQAAAT